MILKHIEYEGIINGGREHLSFGERNAFALILFMYEAISKNVDLVVLDDPISSFDKNKKYAIINTMFGANKNNNIENNFKDKTILMLTHDFEPIIDMVSSLHRTFSSKIVAHFLSEKDGEIIEIPISKDDVCLCSEVCLNNAKNNNKQDIVRIVYLRRYYEITGKKELEYELLSNIIHRRKIPIMNKKSNESITDEDNKCIPMTDEEISIAIKGISEYITDFDYNKILNSISDDKNIKDMFNNSSNNYEKLHLFRLFFEGKIRESCKDDILVKYINEAFHIENEYLMQLDYDKYQVIPSFIIKKCDEIINSN